MHNTNLYVSRKKMLSSRPGTFNRMSRTPEFQGWIVCVYRMRLDMNLGI